MTKIPGLSRGGQNRRDSAYFKGGLPMSIKALTLALAATTALAASALAQDKITIGVSIPAATHGWAGGLNWHAQEAEKRLEALHSNIDIVLVTANSPADQAGDIDREDAPRICRQEVDEGGHGVGMVGIDEIICSCPMTTPTTSSAPFGYQFIGPYPCQKQAFSACSQTVGNGTIVPVGSPPGAGRVLTEALYGQQYPLNECTSN